MLMSRISCDRSYGRLEARGRKRSPCSSLRLINVCFFNHRNVHRSIEVSSGGSLHPFRLGVGVGVERLSLGFADRITYIFPNYINNVCLGSKPIKSTGDLLKFGLLITRETCCILSLCTGFS